MTSFDDDLIAGFLERLKELETLGAAGYQVQERIASVRRLLQRQRQRKIQRQRELVGLRNDSDPSSTLH